MSASPLKHLSGTVARMLLMLVALQACPAAEPFSSSRCGADTPKSPTQPLLAGSRSWYSCSSSPASSVANTVATSLDRASRSLLPASVAALPKGVAGAAPPTDPAAAQLPSPLLGLLPAWLHTSVPVCTASSRGSDRSHATARGAVMSEDRSSTSGPLRPAE